jgi:hypothetical protein
LGTALHTAESADVKVQTYITGEVTLHVAQIVNTEQLHVYPRNMVGFRYVIVNTLYEGDNKDDDDDNSNNDNNNETC